MPDYDYNHWLRIEHVTYTQVGNQDFANYVDAPEYFCDSYQQQGGSNSYHAGHVIRLPPSVWWDSHWGFWWMGLLSWWVWSRVKTSLYQPSCTGQDNPSTQCEVGDVPNIFESDESDHDGPYDGVEMGCWDNNFLIVRRIYCYVFVNGGMKTKITVKINNTMLYYYLITVRFAHHCIPWDVLSSFTSAHQRLAHDR